MTQYTGTIENFMNVHEDFVNALILKKINQTVQLEDQKSIDIENNEFENHIVNYIARNDATHPSCCTECLSNWSDHLRPKQSQPSVRNF